MFRMLSSRGSKNLGMRCRLGVGIPFALVPALAYLLAMGGCSDGANSSNDVVVVPPMDAAALPSAHLQFEGPDTLPLQIFEAAEFHVRYSELDGSPISGRLVHFDLVGSAHDSSLRAVFDRTNQEGLVIGRVRAGSVPTAFRIRAVAERTDPVFLDVSVSAEGFGGLQVLTNYGGTRAVGMRRVQVFANAECSDDPLNTQEEADRSVTLPEGVTEILFDALPRSVPYAVVATAYDFETGGTVVSLGCRDGIVVSAETETRVQVPIEDLPLTFADHYRGLVEWTGLEAATRAAARVRAAGTAQLGALGGQANLLLHALEAYLRDAGWEGEADAVAAGILEGTLGASLEDVLMKAQDGPSTAVEQVAQWLEQSTRQASGSLEVLRSPVAGLWFAIVSEVRVPIARRTVPLTSLRIEDVGTLRLTSAYPGGSEAAIQEAYLPITLGAFSVAAMEAAAEAEAQAGVVRALVETGGCSSLETWVAEQEEIRTGCFRDCAVRACEMGLQTLVDRIVADLSALDEAEDRIVLQGAVTLRDDNLDLEVETIEAASPLTGTWLSEGAAHADQLDADLTLRAVID